MTCPILPLSRLEFIRMCISVAPRVREFLNGQKVKNLKRKESLTRELKRDEELQFRWITQQKQRKSSILESWPKKSCVPHSTPFSKLPLSACLSDLNFIDKDNCVVIELNSCSYWARAISSACNGVERALLKVARNKVIVPRCRRQRHEWSSSSSKRNWNEKKTNKKKISGF